MPHGGLESIFLFFVTVQEGLDLEEMVLQGRSKVPKGQPEGVQGRVEVADSHLEVGVRLG